MNGAIANIPRTRQHSQNSPDNRGFATAGLTYDGQHLSLIQRKADILHQRLWSISVGNIQIFYFN